MKILIYRWSVFHQEDIAEAFESFGHTVEYYEEMPDERKGTDIRRLKEVVAEYDLVFSANYFSRVSNACQAQQKKYIAWTVDSPMLTMFDTSVFNECNYIFLFDKFDYYRARKKLHRSGVRKRKGKIPRGHFLCRWSVL